MKNTESGQVLLIVIMLLATALTVVISVAFKANTESQITKLEEESQKALAAAEAGIDKLLQQGSGSIQIQSLPNLSAFSGEASFVTDVSPQFTSPLIQKDQMYTFYLADYASGGTFSNHYSGTMTLYYGSGSVSCDSVALEITTLSDAAPTITRSIADTGDILGSNDNDIGVNSGGTIDNVIFNCKTTSITIPANSKLMVARVISPSGSGGVSTKIGFLGSASLRLQGRTVNSEARSTTGVTKKVELFQSFPQIPADFFVTSF